MEEIKKIAIVGCGGILGVGKNSIVSSLMLEEAEKEIENLPLEKDTRIYSGAIWLLNHLKKKIG